MLHQQTEIMSIAALLMGIGLITKVFGLLFNSIAISYLGPEAYQQFSFASTLPELISQVILFGAISASVLPILSKVLQDHGEERFMRVFSSLINVSLVLFTVLAVVIAITADATLPWVIDNLVRPVEPISVAEITELAAMMRAMMIPQIILGLSVYLSTVLNIHNQFLVPQLAPLFYNLGRIAAIYLLIPYLGQSPWVLVWGTLAGSILHLVVQIPLTTHLGVRYQFLFDISDRFIHKIGTIALPRISSISVDQFAVFVDRIIAFGLAGNALALYNLAIFLIAVPLSLFGTSFSTASFPSLAKAFNGNNRIIAAQIFYKTLNQIVFFAVPAAVLLIVMRVPVSRLTFGIFGNEVGFLETYTIAWIVLFFAPGIIFESARSLIYRTFYAAHDTIRPLVISVVTMIFGVISGIAFTNYFSHFDTFAIRDLTFNPEFFLTRESGVAAVGGLALSSALIFSLEAIVMIWWLNRKYLLSSWQEIVVPLIKKLIAGVAMFIACYLIYKIWAGLEDTQRTLYLILLTFTTTSASAMIYLGVSWVLGIEEVKTYINILQKYPDFGFVEKVRNFNPFPPSN